MEHFQKLFDSDGVQNLNEVVFSIPKLVDESMNSYMTWEVSYMKIWEAMLNLGALKALGRDGLIGMFYSNHWDMVGPKVCELVKLFFQEGIMPQEINETQVVIVLKIPRLEEVGQFRPVSYHNFICKIITKVKVHKLRKYMDRIISLNPSAFIRERLTQDNIINPMKLCMHCD